MKADSLAANDHWVNVGYSLHTTDKVTYSEENEDTSKESFEKLPVKTLGCDIS